MSKRTIIIEPESGDAMGKLIGWVIFLLFLRYGIF
jgi:hypothetical protein